MIVHHGKVFEYVTQKHTDYTLTLDLSFTFIDNDDVYTTGLSSKIFLLSRWEYLCYILDSRHSTGSKDANMLLLGCGDPRNVLCTIYTDHGMTCKR
jgi:hypothetical protein